MINNKNFGEIVDGYTIPVLNEREIRAAAGIMFLGIFITWILIIFNGNFIPIKYALIIFLTDFSIRLFGNPRFSPLLIIGRFFVRNQNPEYVGAAQKKFAWYIGFILSGTMFLLLVVLNTYSFITGIVCLICLIFMFFESAFGICIGCKIYNLFNKDKAQYCPGEICDTKAKQEIQKIVWPQFFLLFIFIIYIFLTAFFFNKKFQERPHDLFKNQKITELNK
ncbi:DUF4395 domain-containing protein [Aequorivita antarctica]|uniref:DUF4395 domain-containing protein n=1 Tax=Aequorivita antarctica TaxID=153266 RepID=A0A5C6Z0T3_9FLAO|nr:DUF4395 domain-containing protein [Aequorivita antarctica]TXD73262.1 DUF4395 domain-containing protein [Aequorivita antarctica]SRX76015.1 hypothetical protein AEQU3_03013 [Aequorivita antarctica]